eukprot:RCo015062
MVNSARTVRFADSERMEARGLDFEALFLQWDTDGCGSINFPEIQQVLMGVESMRTKAALRVQVQWLNKLRAQRAPERLSRAQFAEMLCEICSPSAVDDE